MAEDLCGNRLRRRELLLRAIGIHPGIYLRGAEHRIARVLADALCPHLSGVSVFAAAFLSVLLLRRDEDARPLLCLCRTALHPGGGAGIAAAAGVGPARSAGMELGRMEPFGGGVFLHNLSLCADAIQQAVAHSV